MSPYQFEIEFIGYVGRAFAHDRTGEITPYIIQSVFLLLAPALFAASMYMVLGRIIRCVRGEKYSVLRVSWLAKVFVGGDVFSFLIQAGGAGLLVEGNSGAKTGKNIIVGGLVVQVIMFGLFALSAIIFEVRMHRHAKALLYNANIPWKETLHMLYYASPAIMLRSIFRVVQYAMGQGGYLLKKEWPLYVFDGLLMFITMVIFYRTYPSEVNPKKTIIREDQDSTIAM
ncbi:MAG: hypothetical protein Q9165_005537 [Trypethelium subeluteriae]